MGEPGNSEASKHVEENIGEEISDVISEIKLRFDTPWKIWDWSKGHYVKTASFVMGKSDAGVVKEEELGIVRKLFNRYLPGRIKKKDGGDRPNGMHVEITNYWDPYELIIVIDSTPPSSKRLLGITAKPYDRTWKLNKLGTQLPHEVLDLLLNVKRFMLEHPEIEAYPNGEMFTGEGELTANVPTGQGETLTLDELLGKNDKPKRESK